MIAAFLSAVALGQIQSTVVRVDTNTPLTYPVAVLPVAQCTATGCAMTMQPMTYSQTRVKTKVKTRTYSTAHYPLRSIFRCN